ncbi:MAG: ABC transporter permease [Lachnospiraceae bacterium]|nr:ABC transporter permease [Lachnospiraceae bacterium]
MLIFENIKMAFNSLRANKMRSLLTMIGIIIGIGAVIAIMTVSASLTHSMSESFQEMGANNVTVGIQQNAEEEVVKANGMRFGTSGRNLSIEEEDRITDEMIAELREEYSEEIDAIALSESIGSGTAENGNLSANINVSGINDEYFESSKISLLAGRKIKSADIEGLKKVVMVSDRVIDNLFEGNMDTALAQPVRLNLDGIYETYYIIGIYQYQSNNTVSEESDSDVTTDAYIPIATGKEEIHAEQGYTQFTIVTDTSVKSVSDFADEIESFFEKYYAANEDYGISTSTMESMTESMTSMIATVSLAIACIAGISLLVGGIGVMNIMLVSVTERTREIGTRKALGAKNSSIRLQFIVEAVLLCLVGGCLGILAGLILGGIAASILGYSAAAPVIAIVIAVAFSMTIGIFFGYYPANKAAKLDPIEALRYE